MAGRRFLVEVRLLRGLVGLRAHLDDDEVCWNRIGNTELVPEGCEMMVDRHPQASIYSHRPIGLGWDELKWEILVSTAKRL